MSELPEMIEDERFNGWYNWETWTAYNWLTAEEYDYIAARAFAVGAGDDYAAGQVLKEWYANFMPKLPPSFWADVLQAGFDSVDWQEIAAALRE